MFGRMTAALGPRRSCCSSPASSTLRSAPPFGRRFASSATTLRAGRSTSAAPRGVARAPRLHRAAHDDAARLVATPRAGPLAAPTAPGWDASRSRRASARSRAARMIAVSDATTSRARPSGHHRPGAGWSAVALAGLPRIARRGPPRTTPSGAHHDLRPSISAESTNYGPPHHDAGQQMTSDHDGRPHGSGLGVSTVHTGSWAVPPPDALLDRFPQEPFRPRTQFFRDRRRVDALLRAQPLRSRRHESLDRLLEDGAARSAESGFRSTTLSAATVRATASSLRLQPKRHPCRVPRDAVRADSGS